MPHNHATCPSTKSDLAPTAVFIDLEKFKQVNNEQGHDTGDSLLRRVTAVFRSRIRAGDSIDRLGGTIRDKGWPVAFSMGVVSCRRAPDDLELLFNKADLLMYEAKEADRDRILQHVSDEVA